MVLCKEFYFGFIFFVEIHSELHLFYLNNIIESQMLKNIHLSKISIIRIKYMSIVSVMMKLLLFFS
jgi:hypothetical protein